MAAEGQIDENSEDATVFNEEPMLGNVSMGLGLVGIAAGLYIAIDLVLVGCGLMLLTIGVIRRRRPIAIIQGDHALLRPAPLASPQILTIKSVRSVEYTPGQRCAVYCRGREKPIDVRIKRLSQKNADELVERLQAHLL